MEVIQAAKTIYTKRGSNAPTKSAITDSAGKDVTPTFAVSVFNSPVEIVEKDS
jgi:hypothetical protein